MGVIGSTPQVEQGACARLISAPHSLGWAVSTGVGGAGWPHSHAWHHSGGGWNS